MSTNDSQAESPVLFITGGAKRVGAAIARRFHREGWRVIVHFRSSLSEAEKLRDELNASRAGSAVLLQADLTDRDCVSRLQQDALAAFGRLDCLVNNASSFYPTTFADASQAQWDDLIDSNLRTAFFLSQALAPALAQSSIGGSIVNLVDTHADRPPLNFSVYGIAKAGVKAMTRSLALELAPTIRVNGVSPGAILWPPSLEDDNDPEVQRKRQERLKRIPMGRLGSTDELAAAVWFFANDAKYVTGQVIAVDGGRKLGL